MNTQNMLVYKGYIGKIDFDPEAKVFYGHVINTRDTITFQSDDAKRLEDEFRTSVETYLAFCGELGEAPEKPYSGRFVLRLPPEGHREVVIAAQLANKSLNTWVTEHLLESAHHELQQYQFDVKKNERRANNAMKLTTRGGGRKVVAKPHV